MIPSDLVILVFICKRIFHKSEILEAIKRVIHSQAFVFCIDEQAIVEPHVICRNIIRPLCTIPVDHEPSPPFFWIKNFFVILECSVLQLQHKSVHGKPRSHNRPKRVQGGTQATPHSNPWLGQLYNKEEFVGNVFLVSRPPYHHSNIEHGSSDIVITNAHYFYIGMNLSDFKVSFGKQILGRLEENQIDVQLKRVFSHHKFRHYDHDNFNQRTAAEERTMYDIAMLKLDQQVHFTKFIKPIALANSSSLANCSFTGWEKQKLGSAKKRSISTNMMRHL
uniref:Peptidase S1 domain-containing protein n=1 Tax=Romanomermis culicivorax TaxID=13658 RepID=A0A915KFY2_ROMCU